MVENPIGDQDPKVYFRVARAMLEEALDLNLPPEEAGRRVRELLKPVVAESSTEEQSPE